MTQEWQWSLETYKLNKIKEMFGLPCVIRLTEGYMADDESEEFATGDIMTIDTEIVSDKVAAVFTRYEKKEVERTGKREPDYGIITSQPEVFLPYGYDGKLKVLKTVADVNGVQQLAEAFPRFATLRDNLSVKTNLGESIKLSKGTKIELDRSIPGSAYGKTDKLLVIQFDHSGKTKIAALPFSTKGKFRTEEDHTEYTISEAIDRFGLPLDVKFSSDEIRRIFAQDVSEGRRPYTKVTGTLRLNRIVKYHVLIGHYKPVSESSGLIEEGQNAEKSDTAGSSDPGGVRRRTVIVLPVDNEEIGNIEVNIYDGDVLTIYEKLVNIQSVAEAKDMVRDTLCVDFSVKPGIKLMAEATRKYANVSHGKLAENFRSRTNSDTNTSGEPPPLPKRPAHPHKISDSSSSHYKKLPFRLEKTPEKDVEGDYEIPTSKTSSPYLEMNFPTKNEASADIPPALPRKPNFSHNTKGPGQTDKGKKHQKGKHWPGIRSPFKSSNKGIHEKDIPMPLVPEEPSEDDNLDGYEKLEAFNHQLSPVAVVRPVATDSELPDDVNAGYEEIEDVIALRKQSEMEQPGRRQEEHAEGTDNSESRPQEELAQTMTEARLPENHAEEVASSSDSQHHSIETESANMPIVNDKTGASTVSTELNVTPSRSTRSKQTNKLFEDLGNEELVERLKLCKLPGVAEICKSENLDGAFFADASIEFLRETVGLQGLQLAKFLKMKDENWVPR